MLAPSNLRQKLKRSDRIGLNLQEHTLSSGKAAHNRPLQPCQLPGTDNGNVGACGGECDGIGAASSPTVPEKNLAFLPGEMGTYRLGLPLSQPLPLSASSI